MEGVKVTVKKGKKKQVKDELDRMKQAEKKKRRLEKALATSAAIRLELEIKKQKKKEEQERLDEEGARIAEAVALHVLLGEDSDEEQSDLWDDDIIVGQGQSDLSKYSPLGNIGLSSDARACQSQNSSFMISSGHRYFGDEVWCSVGHLAAHAVSSLQIAAADDAHMLGG